MGAAQLALGSVCARLALRLVSELPSIQCSIKNGRRIPCRRYVVVLFYKNIGRNSSQLFRLIFNLIPARQGRPVGGKTGYVTSKDALPRPSNYP